MNQEQTIALFKRCEAARGEAKKVALADGKSDYDARDIAHEAAKAIWNGWAEEMLSQRKALEEAGEWAAEKDWKGDLEARNDKTRAWIENATVDFSALRFMSQTLADEEQPQGGEEDTASDAEQPWFAGAHFHGTAGFAGAQFHGTAGFEGAQFHGTAGFDGAQFHGDAGFGGAQFHGTARFGGAQFSARANFDNTTFRQAADYDHVKFDRFASFERARFEGAAKFFAIRGERGFSMADARFEQVPDFIQAHFEEAPRLDNVKVVGRMVPPYRAPAAKGGDQPAGKDSEPAGDGNQPAAEPARPAENASRQERSKWRGKQIAKDCWEARHAARTYPRRWREGVRHRQNRPDRGDITARWRALKRLAIQAHDHDREHEFFAREIRSARFVTDWLVPWPFWTLQGWFGVARFWGGYAYGLFSNYGRSILLPTLWWLGGVAVAANFYFAQHQEIIRRPVEPRPWPLLPHTIDAPSFWQAWWSGESQ